MTVLAVIVLALSIVVPVSRELRHRRAALDEVLVLEAAMGPAIEILRLAVSAGLSVHGAVALLAEHAPPVLRPGLATVVRRVELGDRLGHALDALEAWGEPGRPLVAALRSAAFDGAPLSAALDRHAVEVRDRTRRRAETRARRLPVQLLFPLSLCVLPAFVLLAVVPLLLSSWPAGR